jgi:hypothetical protein
MRSRGLAVVLLVAIWSVGMGSAGAHNVRLLDDCDPDDPAWDASGGCTLKKGDVTLEEFLDETEAMTYLRRSLGIWHGGTILAISKSRSAIP